MPMLILASASPRRRDLLQQIGISPDNIHSTDVDESALNKEIPANYVLRLASEKALKARENNQGSFIIAADTTVAVGRNILHKATTSKDVEKYLRILSGRSHKVYTAVCVINPTGNTAKKLVTTRVSFKRLSQEEIDMYVKSGEGVGKAGGYAIQGLAGCFVQDIKGSYSAVVGLPLLESKNLLVGLGYK